MKRCDREAGRRAIAQCRAESPRRAEQIDNMLRERPFEAVARFAASCCQDITLKLPPWGCPPINAGDEVTNHYGGRLEEVALRKRMRRAGVSFFEPDPLGALEQAMKPGAT
jgi:hypothetical protein